VILPAQEIRKLRPLDPFVERKIAFGTTYGLGPSVYDVRIAETIWLWPGRFLLASTIEHFDMPNDVMAIVHDKSTWARRGVAFQNKVIEPGWRGCLHLVQQFRYPVGARYWELSQGSWGEAPDANPLEQASGLDDCRWVLVIFDSDRVLVDSEPIINRAHPDVLTACGYPITEHDLVERPRSRH
jgi:hypothetical protein